MQRYWHKSLADHVVRTELRAACARSAQGDADLIGWLAERFPQADLPVRIGRIAMDPDDVDLPPVAHDNDYTQVATWPVAPSSGEVSDDTMGPLRTQLAAPASSVQAPRPRLAPLSPGRFALQLTISQETHDLLREALDLLSHSIPSGDLDEVLHRALLGLVNREKKRKFGIGAKPRAGRTATDPRTIPAEIRREVAARDGARCTFTSAGGKRCGCSTRLEFDHTVPVARGGETTVDNLRLRCRAHNQYEAIRAFGAAFIEGKRVRAGARSDDGLRLERLSEPAP